MSGIDPRFIAALRQRLHNALQDEVNEWQRKSERPTASREWAGACATTSSTYKHALELVERVLSEIDREPKADAEKTSADGSGLDVGNPSLGGGSDVPDRVLAAAASPGDGAQLGDGRVS